MNDLHLSSGRKAQKQQTRQKILKAANDLVKNHSPPLSMDEIAQEAGISRATIYRYYSNTEEIATELILYLNVPDSEKLMSDWEGKNFYDGLKGIQNAYLDFIFNNEIPSKKFLGAILSSADPKLERGQNRITSVREFLASKDIQMNPDEKENLSVIATLLMGIEAVMVTKDVCGLDNKKSREVLNWALDRILKGYQ